MPKPCRQLSVDDLRRHAVWEYVADDGGLKGDETYVATVRDLPVSSLQNRLVGALVTFHNGSQQWAVLGSVDLGNAVSTKHFLTLSVLDEAGGRVDLARYHDIDHDRRGPAQFAKHFGLSVEDVFPIEYDIGHIAIGLDAVLRGSIESAPPDRISSDELIKLAIDGEL